jgi:hypothetical protein
LTLTEPIEPAGIIASTHRHRRLPHRAASSENHPLSVPWEPEGPPTSRMPDD